MTDTRTRDVSDTGNDQRDDGSEGAPPPPPPPPVESEPFGPPGPWMSTDALTGSGGVRERGDDDEDGRK